MTSSMPGDMNRDPQGGALIRLRGVYPSLKTALQKVANLIMRQPEMAIYASVNEVAAAAQVSEATVMRFCRTLGFKGFQDFKISLARELVAPSTQRLSEEAGAEDDPPALVRRTFMANIAALEETLEVLDLRLLQEAAQHLLSCRRLAIIGVSGAGPVVQYADLRFNSLGLMVHGFTEKYQMLTAAALLTVGDALLAICHSGNTPGNPGCLPGGQGKRRPGHRRHQQLHRSPDPDCRPGVDHGVPGDDAAPGRFGLFSLPDQRHRQSVRLAAAGPATGVPG